MQQKSLRFFLSQIRANKKNGTSFSQLNHFFKWRSALHPDATSVKDEQPWITYDVIDFLKKNVNGDSKVFEYGGGGSTLFFTKRAKEVVTVEHNKEWFGLLSQIIKDKKYSNWKGTFIAAQKGDLVANPNISDPAHYSSDDAESKGFHYKEYASAIDEYPDNHFDFVLVDGRSRPSCIQHSFSKIRKGGFLILDNSDRKYYLEQFKDVLEKNYEMIIDHFGASPYCDSFTKSSVWRKK